MKWWRSPWLDFVLFWAVVAVVVVAILIADVKTPVERWVLAFGGLALVVAMLAVLLGGYGQKAASRERTRIAESLERIEQKLGGEAAVDRPARKLGWSKGLLVFTGGHVARATEVGLVTVPVDGPARAHENGG